METTQMQSQSHPTPHGRRPARRALVRALVRGRRVAALLGVVLAMTASPSLAAWQFEGSKTEEVLAKGVDATFVRPLSAARVAIGALFFVPAAFLSLPSGREGFDAAYDVLIAEPSEYAFKRKLGEF